MPRFAPLKVTSPKSRIAEVVEPIIHDGAKHGTNVSIVKLKLKSGDPAFGIRWDISSWSANPDLGFPSSRGKPTWFILPKSAMKSLLESLKIALPELDD